MKIKLLSVLLVTVMLVTALPVGLFDISVAASDTIYSGECGDDLIWTLDSEGTLTVSGTGAMNMSPWASYREQIKRIVIEDGVTSVMKSAFYNCSACERVLISDSVTDIGESAFNACTALSHIDLGKGIKNIGDNAFFACENLESLSVPESVENIGVAPFDFCKSLSSIIVAKDNRYYSSDENGVLFNKDKTALIRYPLGSALSKYTIPDGVTRIENKAFKSCGLLEDIEIPDSVQTIGANAFNACKALKKARIGVGVTEIGNGAFASCENLESIIIGNSVKSVGNAAFAYAESLATVYYNGSEADWDNIQIATLNTCLTDAEREYFVYLNIVDASGKITEIMHQYGEKLEPSAIPEKEYFRKVLYKDQIRTELFDIDTEICENTTLYLSYVLDNAICVSADKAVSPGDTFSQKITFGADTLPRQLTLTVGYPKEFTVTEAVPYYFTDVSEVATEITEDRRYTTYSCSVGETQTDSNITPFKIVFEVPCYDIELKDYEITLTDAYLSCDKGDIPLETAYNSTITVKPKLAEYITIDGPVAIDSPTWYTVYVHPLYTSDKSVVWSVNDENIATVDSNGVLTPHKTGTVELTATASDGSGAYYTKAVRVTKYAKLLSLESDVGEWDRSFDPDIIDYTIQVSEDTSSITITATYEGGELKINAEPEIIASGQAMTFDLKYGYNSINLHRENVPDISNLTYYLRIMREEPPAYDDGAVFVKMNCDGVGTRKDPFGTLEEAVAALDGKDGTVYIYGEYDISHFCAKEWKGMVTVKAANEYSSILLKSNQSAVFNGDITFKDIAVVGEKYSHFDPMGKKFVFEPTSYNSSIFMLHHTLYGNGTVEEAYTVLNGGTIDRVYAAGAYSDSYDNGCTGDSTIVINENTYIKKLYLNADSYMDTHKGITIGGNLNIIFNGGAVASIVCDEATAPEISGALNIIFNRALMPENITYPSNVEKGVYIINSNGGGTILPTTTPGLFVVKANEMKSAYINGEFVTDGIVRFPEGLTEVVWYTSSGSLPENALVTEFVGAQIRTKGKQALRYVYRIPADFAKTCVEYGTIVMPRRYLGSWNLKLDFVISQDGKDYYAKKVPAAKIYKEEDGYIYYTACITHIREDNFYKEYVAVPYVIYKDDLNEEKGYYGTETKNITVYSVALEASGDENCDELIKEYLEDKILSRVPKEYFLVRATPNKIFGSISPVSGTGGKDFVIGDRYDSNWNLIDKNEVYLVEELGIEGTSEEVFLSVIEFSKYSENLVCATPLLDKITLTADEVVIDKKDGVMTGILKFGNLTAYLDSAIIPKDVACKNSVRFMEKTSDDYRGVCYMHKEHLFEGLFTLDALEGDKMFKQEYTELYNGADDVTVTVYDCNGDGYADLVFADVPEKVDDGKSFTDVYPEDESLFNSVNTVVKYGIMDPVTETEFCPDDLVTREQMAVFIYRMLNDGEPCFGGENTTPYNDLTDETLFYMISWTYENGIVGLNTTDKFDPTGKIDLLEAYVFLVHALGKGKDGSFAYPYDYMDWAEWLGLDMNLSSSLGYEDVLTRGDVAILLSNALNAKNSEEGY